MKNLKLVRRYKQDYTIGTLFIDDKYFCDTLEDKKMINGVKIPGESCIPEGTYRVFINMSQRFKKLTPWLFCVPCFSGIRIHSGNTIFDTTGCILVGQNKIKGQVLNSRFVFDNLMDELQNESNILIEIKNIL